jgi:putative membrane protein insertion efficiency factor
MKSLALGLLRLYKRWISPAFPAACRYVPTCSEYAIEAVERYGVVRGGLMAGWRILRCHPLAKGGLDAVVKDRTGCGVSRDGASPVSTREMSY